MFTGAIVAKKLDVSLLAELARARPAWSFALVGPVGAGDPGTDVSALRREPNIHLLGPRPYERLPAVLRAADAGLIPYARNALTESVFPMKVYEYLAAGLPVVATPLPALAEVGEVATAPDAEGLARALERALAADSPERRAARSRAAAAHSWERRLQEIAAADRGAAGRGRRDGGAGVSERPSTTPEAAPWASGRPTPTQDQASQVSVRPSTTPGAVPRVSKRPTPTPDAAPRDLLVTSHTPVLRLGPRAAHLRGRPCARRARRASTCCTCASRRTGPTTRSRRSRGCGCTRSSPRAARARLLAYGRARLGGVPPALARGALPRAGRRGHAPRARARPRAA